MQYDLLTRAIELTKPGGRVVYSTCSLDPIENEAVVARVVAGGKVRVVPREIWGAQRTRKSGRELIPGDRWRPLKVIHLGLIAARLRKGRLDRTVSRAARRLREEISGPFVNVDENVIDDILRGKEPLRTDISSLQDTDRGSRILVGSRGYCLAVWVGNRVTPMVSQSERTVMRGVRDLSFGTKEEE